MNAETTRYLTIHFAPSTACVVVPLDEQQFAELSRAMKTHNGEVTLDVSSHNKASLKVGT